MKKITYLAGAIVGLSFVSASLALADAPSVVVTSLSPGTTVLANTVLTFNIAASGFSNLTYQESDSFGSTSSFSADDISAAGQVTWIPTTRDVGTHVLTLTVSDSSGATANTMQTITVSPPPSLSVQSLLPGHTVLPGTKLTFTISPQGFTSATYIAGDSFSGASVGNANIDSSGNFSWSPDISQDGTHTITIYASDALGHHASVDVPVQVGVGPSIAIIPTIATVSVALGHEVDFSVNPTNFSPTAFSVSDRFAGSTINNNDINLSGQFSWMPTQSDIGTHVITVTGQVGAYGQSATTSQTVIVLGAGGVAPTASTTSNTTQSALQAQLALLQAQLAAHSGAPASSASSVFTFTLYLHPGSSGDEVTHLQTVLAQLGFLGTTPNGNYGPMTTAAVIKFQAAHGLSQLGVVGPATRAALNALGTSSTVAVTTTASGTGDGFVFNYFMGLGEDSTDGTDVLELQKRLAVLGFFAGEQTGSFGSATEAAVKKFQIAQGISATGYVGSATRAALNKAN